MVFLVNLKVCLTDFMISLKADLGLLCGLFL